MASVLGPVVVVCGLLCGQASVPQPAPPEQPGSYIWKYEPGPDGKLVPRPYEYVPQPGDMVFFDDHNANWEKLYKFVGSGPPFHSGLIIPLPDGTPAIFESGPDDTMWVRILAMPSRLQGYTGDVWIRQVRQPLPPEARTRMTEWALKQEHKHYALWRLLLQGTPFRCRSDWQCKLFGATKVDRGRFLCSELVVCGATVGGLLDPKVHFANAIYPRDIIFDNKYDLSANYYEARYWSRSLDRPPPGPVPR